MGRIVVREVRRIERRLELTAEDIEKRKQRKERWNAQNVHPAPTDHEKRFANHLLKCPFCGKSPRFLKTTACDPSGYDYKLTCDLHAVNVRYPLECGDWFSSVSRAGRDWNERVRMANMDEQACDVFGRLIDNRRKLTRQQYRTLKGQIFAGDADGAERGLERILEQGECKKMEGNEGVASCTSIPRAPSA
ncbi:MAG: hypothetical protein ACI4PG_06490 [Candidatus Ventricola sp.]